MNKSTTRSRLNQRKRKRARQRRIQLVKLLCVIVMITVSVIGIKSGLELSRNLKYPVEYSSYIVKYSKENELDPYLVMAVIKQESNYIADAKSPYAGGLMQLTEETAADYASRMGLTDYDYMEPETNIRIGCYVLSSLIEHYGVVDTALAAYNAGIGNVNKWLKNPQYSDDGINLKYIPFSETRHYVKNVNNYYVKYKENVELKNKEEGNELYD